ncbi:MAG: polysaccharide deacetylase family protein [Pseudomonadota bacterium]
MRKIAIGVAGLLLVLVGVWQLSVSRSFQLFGDMFDRVETSDKVVALTFDDGPTPRHTQALLAVLREKNVKATFYLTGQEITKNPQEGREIVAAGHEVGNHTYTHPRMLFKSYGKLKGEVDTTEAAIRSIGYIGPLTFRPPYGKKLLGLPFYLSQRGITSVMWDVAPEDSAEVGASADKIIKHVADNVRPGSIVLLHVMYKSRQASMAAVPGVIDALRQKGYTFVTVSELAKRRTKP